MIRELRNLLAWALILASTTPAFANPGASRCHDLHWFVEGMQSATAGIMSCCAARLWKPS